MRVLEGLEVKIVKVVDDSRARERESERERNDDDDDDWF